MKNEPVAWLWIHKGVVMNALLRNPDCNERNKEYWSKKGWHSEPLYTHPAKTQSHTETAIKILNYLGYSHEPSKEEGADARRDKLVEIISQSHPAKTLTDEEIQELAKDFRYAEYMDFARAILRKAQEK